MYFVWMLTQFIILLPWKILTLWSPKFRQISSWKVISYLLSLPHNFEQIRIRLKQTENLESVVEPVGYGLTQVRNTCDLCCSVKPSNEDLQKNKISIGKGWRFKLEDLKHHEGIVRNCLLNVAIDVSLGITFCFTINFISSANNISQAILNWRDATKHSLDELLNWLMGAPAGLKLNRDLTVFLGHFFLYHIQIWMGYLSLIEIYLETIVQAVICSGCLGLTFMLSLANDAVSVLTFHLYCFYVYAARIYSLQIHALLSLARLFRGKKWNPLRQRVDSLSYDADQLAIGTILFTVLLFLLPTTGLYYIVFASLRMAIMFIQFALKCIVNLINTFPFHLVMHRLMYPIEFKDSVSFDMIHKGEDVTGSGNDISKYPEPFLKVDDSLYLYIKYHPISYWTLIKKSTKVVNQSVRPLDFMKSIFRGDIINPWTL